MTRTRHFTLPTTPASRSRLVDHYGCDRHSECDSYQEAPPYDPDQPQKCNRHGRWMTTLIPSRALTF